MSDLFSFQLLFSAFLTVVLILFTYGHRRLAGSTMPPVRATTPSTHQSLKPLPFLGVLPYFIKNRHRFLEWMADVLAASPTMTFVFVSPGQVSGVVTVDPRNVEYILKTNFRNYSKGSRTVSMMEDFLGGGIFNSDGEPWRSQRKATSLEFNTRSRDFAAETVWGEIRERLVPVLERLPPHSGAADFTAFPSPPDAKRLPPHGVRRSRFQCWCFPAAGRLWQATVQAVMPNLQVQLQG